VLPQARACFIKGRKLRCEGAISLLLVRFLGHLGSATLAAGVMGVILSFTLPRVFKEPLLPFALIAGVIMGYLVNRNMRDLTARWVWIIPLVWLAYGILDSTRFYSTAWSHQSRFADIWDNFFGTRCSGSECMNEFLFTAPFLSSISYSITACFASKKIDDQVKARGALS
jgi:hypothetical protein